MVKKIVFILIFLISAICLNAQKQIVNDTSTIIIRVPDDAQIGYFKNLTDFQYEKADIKPVTFWDKLRYWLLDKFFRLFSNTGAAPYIRYILIGLLVFGFIILILNTNVQSLLFKSKNHIKIDYNISEEDLANMDLDALINLEISKKSYKLAVRYLFLKTLKIMTEKGIIEWKFNKTNKDFLVEVKNKKYFETFKDITKTFEYVWYGNFTMSTSEFEHTNRKFYELFKQIG